MKALLIVIKSLGTLLILYLVQYLAEVFTNTYTNLSFTADMLLAAIRFLVIELIFIVFLSYQVFKFKKMEASTYTSYKISLIIILLPFCYTFYSTVPFFIKYYFT